MPLPKISIIIPVYNTEKYLRECLDSVLSQTLQDIEIIVVNDASSDNSQNIIDEYVAKDARIVALEHTENKQQGTARNTALEVARGEYLMFLDSDDSFLPHSCAQALRYIEGSDYQIVEFCKALTDSQNRKTLQDEYADMPQKQRCYEGFEIMEANFTGMLTTGIPTKIYRRDFWQKHQLCFPEHVIFEDNYIIVDIFYACQKLLKVNEILYRHRQHGLSTTNRPISEKAVRDKLKALEHQRELIFRHEEYLKLRPIVDRLIKDQLLAYYLYYIKVSKNGFLGIQPFIQAAVDFHLLNELLEELDLERRSFGLYSRKRRLRNWLRPRMNKLRSFLQKSPENLKNPKKSRRK